MNHHSDHMSPGGMDMDMAGGRANVTAAARRKGGMMHMTFFWGTDAQILFSGWPGTRPAMYALSLVVVFALAFLVEWLSGCRLVGKGTGRVAAGLIRTGLHGARMGLAYVAMLAVMSFNGGVLLAAVAGHAVGFLVFRSEVWWNDEVDSSGYYHRRETDEGRRDLPPVSC